jgi:hypothetical protein
VLATYVPNVIDDRPLLYWVIVQQSGFEPNWNQQFFDKQSRTAGFIPRRTLVLLPLSSAPYCVSFAITNRSDSSSADVLCPHEEILVCQSRSAIASRSSASSLFIGPRVFSA